MIIGTAIAFIIFGLLTISSMVVLMMESEEELMKWEEDK